MKYLALICLGLFGSLSLDAQNFVLGLNQAELLQADAGTDTLVCKTHSVMLGSGQSAWGGSGDYYYVWYPDAYLDNSTAPNPICTPEETTTYVLTVTDSRGCSAVSYVTVAVDECLSTNPLSLPDKISVFPNPSTNWFSISGLSAERTKVTVKIMNQIGQTLEVHHPDTPQPGGQITIRQHSGLKPGIYLIQIETGDQVLVKNLQIN